jgi:hypothetical protein
VGIPIIARSYFSLINQQCGLLPRLSIDIYGTLNGLKSWPDLYFSFSRFLSISGLFPCIHGTLNGLKPWPDLYFSPSKFITISGLCLGCHIDIDETLNGLKSWSLCIFNFTNFNAWIVIFIFTEP